MLAFLPVLFGLLAWSDSAPSVSSAATAEVELDYFVVEMDMPADGDCGCANTTTQISNPSVHGTRNASPWLLVQVWDPVLGRYVRTITVSISLTITSRGAGTCVKGSACPGPAKPCSTTATALVGAHHAGSSSGNGYWVGNRFLSPGMTEVVPLDLQTLCVTVGTAYATVQDMDGAGGSARTPILSYGYELSCGDCTGGAGDGGDH